MTAAHDGTTLAGRYVLDRRLSRRADGLERWSAHDTTLERELAAWVIPAGHPHVAAAIDGARRAAAVEDSRLARVLDVGHGEDIAFVLEEALVESTTLGELLTQGPVHPEEARRIVGELAHALETARHRGLHHLHLDPSSVRRAANGDIKLVGTAMLAGLSGDEDVPPADAAAADTHGLAALLHAALTGTWPLGPGTVLPASPLLASGHALSPSELVEGVPGDLDALARLTLRDQGGPQTPGELARQLGPWRPHQVDAAGGAASGVALPAEPPAEGTRHAGRPSGRPRVNGGAGRRGRLEDDTPISMALPTWGSLAASDAGGGSGPFSDSTGLIPVVPAPGADVEPVPATTAHRVLPAQGLESLHGAYEHEGVDEGDELAAYDDAAALPEAARPDPSPAQTGIALALVAGFLALALAVAYHGVSNVFRSAEHSPQAGSATSAPRATGSKAGDAESGSPTTDAPTQESGASGSPSASSGSSTSPTAGAGLSIAGISSYDPEGDQQEKPELVANVNRPGAGWRSHYYQTQNWGGIGMTGLGLRVDLGSPQEVREVKVGIPQGAYGYDIYIGDAPAHTAGAQKVASYTAQGSTTTSVDGVTGRYVFIWFTTPWRSPYGYVAQVGSVSVS